MAKPLSILYVSSEVFPFAKVGGIGDIAYSLPLAIRDLGHDIRVMLPKYGIISERKNRIHEINRLRDMPIPISDRTEKATVKSSSIQNPRAKVQAYITTNLKYFDNKKGIYSDPKTGKDYADNDERFIFFNRSVIETCLLLGWFPDILHCNDWQTALIAGYAKALFPNKFKKTKIVLTVHTFGQQGVFPLTSIKKIGLPKDAEQYFIHNDKCNFLKGGIHYADYVNTVSPTYSQEVLQDVNHTNGLNSFLIENSHKFKGILNQIDNWSWNPCTDSFITKVFDDNSTEFKEENKRSLLKNLGLEYNSEIPIIGMVSKFSEQKGIQLFIDAAEELFMENIYVVLLGDGDPQLKTQLKKLDKKFSEKFVLKIGFDEKLAHLIEAGSDMFMMPSLYEPCGLNSMYSLQYGSVPIVRATGGLIDIAEEYNSKTKEGNSFIIKDFTVKSLMSAVKKAISLYNKQPRWAELRENIMKSNFYWSQSVKEYEEIYVNVLKD